MKQKQLLKMTKKCAGGGYSTWILSTFLLTLVACVLFLLIGTFAPQNSIDVNIILSAESLMEEGKYPRILDKTDGGQLDNFSEAQILAQSKAMSRKNLESILTNPQFNYGSDPVTSLYQYANEDNLEPNGYYSRYWMGFRAIVRWLLATMNYMDIRRYLAFTFFSVFLALICSMAKTLGSRIAYAFAVSVLLIRPQVVCSSLQFSCCFLIAFMGMLLVPWIYEHRKYEGIFFLELGMLTMFFDFYTTPIVTFGFPMIYLYLLCMKQEGSCRFQRVMKNLGIWFAAYIAMWIAKMILTELFTSQKAVEAALNSAMQWLGSPGHKTDGALYSPLEALKVVARTVLSRDHGAALTLPVLTVALLGAVVYAVRQGVDLLICKKYLSLVMIGFLPVLWFAVASEPTRVHAWFQYRSISVMWWAISSYFCLVTESKPQK